MSIKSYYLLQGKREEYLNQLWELVLNYEAGKLELYRELKKQYTASEWNEKREEIFSKLPQYAHVEQLYKEEKMYDRLLEHVMKSPGLYELQEYAKVLEKEYPEEILQKYKIEVEKMAEYTGDRTKYRQLVGLLRKMKEIRGGSKIVDEMALQWKVKYRNRPAMMDELGKM